MCKSFIQTDIEILCEEVKQLTNINDHTGARIIVAKHFGLLKIASLFEHIEAINKLEGHLPQQIIEYRQMVYKQMMEFVRMKATVSEFNNILKSF